MAYKSKFTPTNKEKYLGNIKKILTRSTWELALCKWCDRNEHICKWSLENVIVKYYDELTYKDRRYIVDFYIETTDGEKLLVEVKPHRETKPPQRFSNQHKELKEILYEAPNSYNHPSLQKKYRRLITYLKNQAKWKAAAIYAEERNWKFVVWTEHQFKALGIKIVTPLARKKRYYRNNVKRSRRKVNGRQKNI